MSFEIAREHKSRMKRLRLPMRRRREGKTDYRQRHNLIRHSKRNYGEVKSRLVVRLTNNKVICQIVQAYQVGDKVICSAESTELAKYGVTFGLKNYSAAYATGFLCARKLLSKLGLAEEYTGKEEIDGEDYLESDNEEGPQAFRCYLDLGLARSSNGAKVFAAMKGACDGGLHIPHSPSKFTGYDKESEEVDAEVFRKRIFGQHVAEYMTLMKEENPEKYEVHFSEYIKQNITPDMIEGIYESAFEKIRADTFVEKSEKKTYDRSQYKLKNEKRLSGEEKKLRALAKLQTLTGTNQA
ncbi:large subunit ribosomal protein L5e [Nematocida homosporus]|uniref:large subunit ribosomal protein L5e n=1 Tax=Nematocida homosporus TaxID=1912981 RepID=UPI00221F3999|nr:large subunit ribosomal protein L5e [Nematocida homosporus]KAI5184310.1 large subunit ribosomal protein L5e [Nematocida homosporus]